MNFLDPDQTYDILFAQKISGQVLGLLGLDSHGIFGDSICFIDRIVPNPISPWCEDWSGKMFEFLKKLSRTHILDNGELNGSAYGFAPEYTADLPDSLNLGGYLPPPILTVTVPPNSEGTITWQEIEGTGPYCDKLSNSITVTRRRGRFFRNGTKEPQTYELFTANWLHNSVCFDGVELELTDNQAKFLLYDQMESFLDHLWDELGIPECKVLTGYSGKKTQTVGGNGNGGTFNISDSTETINPVYSSVPDSYHYAFLLKDGTSTGVLTTNYDSDADVIFFTVNDSYNYFSDGPQTFDINSAFLVNSSPTTISASLVSESSPTFGVALSSFSYFLRHNASGDIAGHSSQTPPWPAPPEYVERIISAQSFNTITQQYITYTGNTGSVTEHIHTNTIATKSRGVRSGGIVFGFAGNDPNLFNSFEAGYASTGLNTVNDAVGKSFTDSVSELVSQTISRTKQDISSTYRVTLQDNAEELPSIENTGFNQSYGSIDYAFSGNTNITSTVHITRTIGGNNNPPELIVFMDNEPSIFRGETAQNLIESIIYPDGPDQPSILDPDPDNGDIMPDSTRIKEIHAALEADRFGVHPGSTEESPKANLRTLGRLLESAAYVLGVNFDEDGNNVPYPDPQLLPPEKIEEVNSKKILKNAQFAVANVNNQFDTSSLYEVRSALFKPDEDNTIDQRPYAVKYHNLPQLIDVMADDTSKQLGGGKNSIFQVPNASGDDFQQYEGMYQALADALYMLSGHSKAINELQNQGIKTVYMLSQILKAMGVPCHVEKINGVTGVFDDEGNEIPGFLAVPGLDKKSPTLVGLMGIILMNLQRVVGSSIGFRTDEPTEEEKGATVTITARPTKIKAKDGGNINFVVTRKTKGAAADDELIYVNLMFNSTLGKGAFSGDFKPGLWSLDLQPGEKSKAFSITVEKNESLTEEHSLTVVLSGGDGYELGIPKTATVLITPTEDKEDKETELTENDWLLKFDLPDPKPDFVPDLTEEI